MDKKNNTRAPATRGSITDSKKSQDVVNGKAWPKGRRREPAGGSLGIKAEPSRKPQPQRVKTAVDKRPKPRGFYNSGQDPARLDEEQDVELGSVFLPGSKKQSLNHLLNFVYSPREKQLSDNHKHKIATKKHKYNKEQFLQANCQFIVKDSGNYKLYLNDPDALVDWSLVEQVNVQVNEAPSCPICLYPPIAAKMTRCGHIYCWSCILHYLALTDKPWRKCPICYEAVNRTGLKSVISVCHPTFNINETITFKLMKRPKGSLTAYPADAETFNDLYKVSEVGQNEVYSKLLVAAKNDICDIIERERIELNQQLSEVGDCPEKCFVEQAIQALEERQAQLLEQPQIEPDISDTLDDLCLGGEQPKFHYFYQASDGQHIYLHALNARMLEHSYGSLEFGPRTITAKILEKEGGSMTEDLRKRLRYLQHLPVTCQFEVAEVHLKQPIVTKDTLEFFNEQIEIRKKKRQRRAREEKRRERKIAEEENRIMGKFPSANLMLESNDQFPEFGFEPRLRSESETTQVSEESEPLSTANELTGPTFATMLSSEKKQQPQWPKLKAAEAPLKLINVTGAKMRASCSTRGDSDEDLGDYEPVPSFNASFSDAIAEALQKVEIEEKVENGKKKKKKNKQKVLFTTNMAYCG